MLDKYLNREDVHTFLAEINNMSIYGQKSSNLSSIYSIYDSDALSLYAFYDALLKYVVIIDDEYLFTQYLNQIKKIYRRIDNIEDIKLHINKLICKMVSLKLDIQDINEDIYKKQIISYIYNKYIIDGYLIHGFSTVYEKSIKNNSFIPEIYVNYYEKMIEINNIFLKYCNIKIIDKNFDNNSVYFTNDMIMGCLYSRYSPGYFFKFLLNNNYYSKKKSKSLYLNGGYDKCISSLKRFMDNHMFSDTDKKFVLDTVLEEWNYLHSVPKKISLLLVKRRSIFKHEGMKLEDFLNDNKDIYEIVDRLLSPKRNNVSFNEVLDNNQFIVLSLNDVNKQKKKTINDIRIEKESEITNEYNKEVINMNKNFIDAYGNASILIILGSLLITLGVIITVIFMARGM